MPVIWAWADSEPPQLMVDSGAARTPAVDSAGPEVVGLEAEAEVAAVDVEADEAVVAVGGAAAEADVEITPTLRSATGAGTLSRPIPARSL